MKEKNSEIRVFTYQQKVICPSCGDFNFLTGQSLIIPKKIERVSFRCDGCEEFAEAWFDHFSAWCEKFLPEVKDDRQESKI